MFGVVNTQADILQAYFTVQSHIAQTGVAVFTRPGVTDTQAR